LHSEPCSFGTPMWASAQWTLLLGATYVES
jgi:hypothetical protein